MWGWGVRSLRGEGEGWMQMGMLGGWQGWAWGLRRGGCWGLLAWLVGGALCLLFRHHRSLHRSIPDDEGPASTHARTHARRAGRIRKPVLVHLHIPPKKKKKSIRPLRIPSQSHHRPVIPPAPPPGDPTIAPPRPSRSTTPPSAPVQSASLPNPYAPRYK